MSFRAALAMKPDLPKPMALTVFEQLEAEQAADVGAGDEGDGSGQQCEIDSSAAGCPAAAELPLPAAVAEKQHAVRRGLLDAEQCEQLAAIATTADATEQQVFSHPAFVYRLNPTPAIDETNRQYHRPGWELNRRTFQWYYKLADEAVVTANAVTCKWQWYSSRRSRRSRSKRKMRTRTNTHAQVESGTRRADLLSCCVAVVRQAACTSHPSTPCGASLFLRPRLRRVMILIQQGPRPSRHCSASRCFSMSTSTPTSRSAAAHSSKARGSRLTTTAQTTGACS